MKDPLSTDPVSLFTPQGVRLVSFNVNDYVRVRLTDHGRRVHREYFQELDPHEKLGNYRPPPEDAQGWSRWQAWNLMSLFGDHMFNGCRVPFDTAIEIEVRDGK